jgi:hypothetical protein
MNFGYLRESAAPKFPGDTAADQAAVIRAFGERHGLAVDEWFVDAPDAASTPWLERPAGRFLAERLKAGTGHNVIVAAGEWVYTSAAGLLGLVEDWQARGIVLHLATVPYSAREFFSALSTDGLPGEALVAALRTIRKFNFNRASERSLTAITTRKSIGIRHTNYAGYGFAWKGRRGHQVRVPHPGELAAIARIIERRNAGASWNRIAAELLHERVLTRDGREWSPSRVRRAYFAARLHAEAHPTLTADIPAHAGRCNDAATSTG